MFPHIKHLLDTWQERHLEALVLMIYDSTLLHTYTLFGSILRSTSPMVPLAGVAGLLQSIWLGSSCGLC